MKLGYVSSNPIQLSFFFRPNPTNTIPNNNFQAISRFSYPAKLRVLPVLWRCKAANKLSIKGVKKQIARTKLLIIPHDRDHFLSRKQRNSNWRQFSLNRKNAIF